MKPRFPDWLALVRLPNLFTVPGDAWAGYALASLLTDSAHSVVELCMIGLALTLAYAGGLIQNDVTDVDEDRRERSTRPLAAARISVRSAKIALTLCWSLALLAATITADIMILPVFILLLALIALYNRVLKSQSMVWACATMGACRGLSLIAGAAVAADTISPVVFVMAFWLAAYIGTVTWIARNETHTQRFTKKDAYRPCGVLIGLFLTGLFVNLTYGRSGLFMILGLSLASVTLIRCGSLGKSLQNNGEPVSASIVQQSVGGLIRTLLPAQATLLLLFSRSGSETVLAAIPLFIGWPLAHWTGRRFKAS